ncbi:Transposase [Mycetohabitans rhizoxinica HKI 454]|uniref:Transposase n=1 Tax=Mycetohabitans rhizoxinica (strain DSM 19002 / CIP 109453 / HKI 454) TaxID=882378 RepID=E5AQE0_MYCRK|nr:Transposase [Mycetohabitans rhizoxinica HKI 454]
MQESLGYIPPDKAEANYYRQLMQKSNPSTFTSLP